MTRARQTDLDEGAALRAPASALLPSRQAHEVCAHTVVSVRARSLARPPFSSTTPEWSPL